MRTPDQLASLLSKLAPQHAEKPQAAHLGANASPLTGCVSWIHLWEKLCVLLPDAASSAPDVKPEASYLALFISVLIKCLSAERELKAGLASVSCTQPLTGFSSVPGPHIPGPL